MDDWDRLLHSQLVTPTPPSRELHEHRELSFLIHQTEPLGTMVGLRRVLEALFWVDMRHVESLERLGFY